MSHLHIPDGVIPIFWLVLGYALTALILAIALRRAGAEDGSHQLPRLGIVAALMLVGMTVEIVLIGYHVNLAVLAGILLGPWLGLLAAFIVNLILALFGHGGITVVGLNSLIIGSESVLGWAIFRVLRRRLEARWAAALAVFAALALSTTLMIGIVALTRTDPSLAYQAPSADAPGQLFHFELLAGDEEHNPMAGLDLTRFAQLVYLFGSIGWIVEAAFTALVVGFLARARPEMLETRPRTVPKEQALGTRTD